ncbi:MAG: DUF6492 family protein [Pseudomonadota bacterium]
MTARRTALITPSYFGDYERCQLLCDSVDRFIDGPVDHYILVDAHDHDQFLGLRGPHRHVINEEDILPNWLHAVKQGTRQDARRLWWSFRTWPMRGWHVQQLRRIAIANYINHDALLYCDSDMLFVRPFSVSDLWRGDALRLYRKPNGIGPQLPDGGKLHMLWTRSAARLNGLPKPDFPAHDYINNLVSWRRQDVVDMCAHIEMQTGKHWAAAIGSNRSFSECQIFGAYSDGVLGGKGVWHAPTGLCKTYWSGAALDREGVGDFARNIEPNQVAIGIQSFTNTNPEILRALIEA